MKNKSKPKLTFLQNKLYDFIVKFFMDHQKQPTKGDMAGYMNVKPPTIDVHLKAMERKNYIRLERKGFTIKILP